MGASYLAAEARSWGRFPRQGIGHLSSPMWRDAVLENLPKDLSILPLGCGRSYGDSCLNQNNTLVCSRHLTRFIAFDTVRGVLRCESGVTLADILALVVPHGWFLPVTPGTKWVSVGGAIANDVHGKNHHRAGTFGHFLRCFELQRSAGERLVCSKENNAELYAATIGGLGLTGFITWAELQLVRLKSDSIDQEVIRFQRLEEFFTLTAESDASYEFTVAWIDCFARGKALGRGLFMRGNYGSEAHLPLRGQIPTSKLKLSGPLPDGLLNAWSMQLFNALYFHTSRADHYRSKVHYNSFFYPLDAVENWNLAYGSRGFLQYQCVVPDSGGDAAIREILQKIAAAQQGSFLAVLKKFGDAPAAGLLSFARKGVTLALDFPNTGHSLFALLQSLDDIVLAAGGALYPAKDARMSPRMFAQSFPQLAQFVPMIDARFSSSFWRRVSTLHG